MQAPPDLPGLDLRDQAQLLLDQELRLQLPLQGGVHRPRERAEELQRREESTETQLDADLPEEEILDQGAGAWLGFCQEESLDWNGLVLRGSFLELQGKLPYDQ